MAIALPVTGILNPHYMVTVYLGLGQENYLVMFWEIVVVCVTERLLTFFCSLHYEPNMLQYLIQKTLCLFLVLVMQHFIKVSYYLVTGEHLAA